MIDDQLPADARALLAAGRDRMGPDVATVARLRARVEVAVIVGASATAASASVAQASAAPASATVASTTAASVAAKSIAVKLVLLATVGTSAYVAHDVVTKDRSAREVVAPQIVTTRATEETDVERVIAVAAPEPAPAESAPVEPAPAKPEPAKPAPAKPVPAEPATVEPAIERAVEPPRATLSREIELVDRATVAVRGSDLDAALATLRAYDAETVGHGQLAQDAAALHIEVLCRMHDATAIGELAVFDKRWPRSPQRSHLTTVCTEVSK